MAEITVLSQTSVSYDMVQQVLRLLPDAIAEAGSGTPNMKIAAYGLVSAATGAVAGRFVCVAVDSGNVVGFMAGLIETDAFVTRSTARDVFGYVRPSARATTAEAEMRDEFERWARSQKASHVQLAKAAGETMEKQGYIQSSVIWTKEISRD